jgi:hypothetical protein
MSDAIVLGTLLRLGESRSIVGGARLSSAGRCRSSGDSMVCGLMTMIACALSFRKFACVSRQLVFGLRQSQASAAAG